MKPWSEVIQQAKWRYEFFREQLEYQVGSTDGLKYIHRKFANLLPSVNAQTAASSVGNT